MPRALARVHLAIVAAIAIVALIGGIAMQLELWSPGATWSIQRYTWMLELHGLFAIALAAPALAGCVGYVAVADLVEARRVPAAFVAWIGLGVWVIGLGATVVALVVLGDPNGWTMYTPYGVESTSTTILKWLGPMLCASAGLVYAIHLGVVIGLARVAVPMVLAGAFVVGIAGACVAAIGRAPGLALHATTFAALVLATAALTRGVARGHVLALIALGLAGVWAFTPLRIVGLALAGVWIALAVIGGMRRPVVAALLAGLVPVIALYVVVAVALAVAGEVHLHDTYAAVAEYHLLAAVVGYALLAAIATWSARTPHPVLLWLGAVICTAGLLVQAGASLRIGTQGMPRRYWDYDPSFEAGHRLAGIGGGVAIAGVLVLALAWLMRARSSRSDGPRPPA